MLHGSHCFSSLNEEERELELGVGMLFVCACFCVDNSDDFERKNSRLFLSRGAPTCLNHTP